MTRKAGLKITEKKPLYRQIAEVLTAEITEHYSACQLLPSEGELAERFGVNRHTLRRAIDELVVRGRVTRQHGKGIIVNAPAVTYTIHPDVQFSKNMESMGLSWRNEVVSFDMVEASSEVAEQLQVKGCDVLFMQTLRFINERPVCLTTHYFHGSFFACLELYHEGSLHDHLREKRGVSLQRKCSEISASLVDGDVALHLRLPLGASILCVNSVNVSSETGLPVEYSKSLFRGDSTKLYIDINKRKMK